ncbi:spore coat protein [Alkalihalophilus pseudofirmus]|nr:spore coat protein [Alkalihalophilus pseudofirmus]
MGSLRIIAEVANAHQGDPEILKSLIKAAAESGADAIKFQWFKYDCIATKDYRYYEIYQTLFIPEEKWVDMLSLANNLGLEIWIDVIDSWGLELVTKLNHLIDGLKLPSTVLQSDEMIKGIVGLNKPILLGVGGWYYEDIDEIILNLKEICNSEIILMHGFQGYPTRIKDTNLKRIYDMSKRYHLQIGFADHIDGSNPLAIDLPVYSYFMGAKVIEKHITLNRATKGYDYFSSLEPIEFKEMVERLRVAEVIMGDGNVNDTQRNYLKDALRTVAKENIATGEIINIDKVSFKRSSKEALMPDRAREILPRISKSSILADQPITPECLDDPVITIVVVCRLKSTRLRKKAILPINGVASIERCLLNCLAVKNVNHVVLATSNLPEDDPLENFTLGGRVKVVRGDPDNVVKRMIKAANITGANIALRVTGDNPAVSPEILTYLINSHLKSGVDFTNAVNSPIGTAADVITLESLYRLSNHPKQLTHTEYLSGYYLNNTNKFNVNVVDMPVEFQIPNCRLTLDEKQDLDMFEELYSGLKVGKEPLFLSEISKYLEENPEIKKLNADVSIKWRDDESLFKEINERTKLD